MIPTRLRDAWRALRGYAAAQDARSSTWAASGGSANSEVASASTTITRRARAEAIADIAAAVAPLLNRKPSGTTLVTAANDADRNNILTRPERLALVERALLYRLLGTNN